MHFLYARISSNSYLHFTDRVKGTFVHSFLKINTFFQLQLTGQYTRTVYIQPEGADQPAMSHGTQRKAPRATLNPELRFSNYFSCSVQIVTVQSNDMHRRLHDH
jgi:hypothetical protein